MSTMPWNLAFSFQDSIASFGLVVFLLLFFSNELEAASFFFLDNTCVGPFSVDTFHAAAAAMTGSRVDFSRTVPRPKFSGLSKFSNHGEPRRGVS